MIINNNNKQLTIWHRHLCSLTSFSRERHSITSASPKAPSLSCLFANLGTQMNWLVI